MKPALRQMLYVERMSHHILLRADLSIDELEQRYRVAKEPDERT